MIIDFESKYRKLDLNSVLDLGEMKIVIIPTIDKY